MLLLTLLCAPKEDIIGSCPGAHLQTVPLPPLHQQGDNPQHSTTGILMYNIKNNLRTPGKSSWYIISILIESPLAVLEL